MKVNLKSNARFHARFLTEILDSIKTVIGAKGLLGSWLGFSQKEHCPKMLPHVACLLRLNF